MLIFVRSGLFRIPLKLEHIDALVRLLSDVESLRILNLAGKIPAMGKSKGCKVHILIVVMLFVATNALLLVPANSARGESAQSAQNVGEEYEISRGYVTNGSSGSSHGRDTFLVRVIGVRAGGLELEYDLPKKATIEDRARNWQFPARVFRPTSGPLQLLNGPELEARVEDWLKAAGLNREMCGRWIFTWNAFRIECDLQSVIRTVETLDLGSTDLREGAAYRDAEARGPGTLMRKADGPDGESFIVTMEIDPEVVRRARAESDVVLGEIMRKPVTLDAALRERAKESISGTISVTFDTDTEGNAWRRTKATKMEIKGPDGRYESETATEVVERRPASGFSVTE